MGVYHRGHADGVRSNKVNPLPPVTPEPPTPAPKPSPMEGDIFFPRQPENTNTGIALRQLSRDIGNSYLNYTRGYILSKLSGTGDISVITNNLLKTLSTDLVNEMNSYFPVDAVTKFTNSFSTMTGTLLSMIDMIAEGKDFTSTKEILNNNISIVASSLNALNSTTWPTASTINVLSKYAESMINQMLYRKNSNWESDISEFQNAYRLMVSTPLVNNLNGTLSFFDALSLGVIQSQPWRFTA